MNYFTSDTHFGADAFNILAREMRPFNTPLDYTYYQINMWNKQASEDDTIYHLGDYFNYNGQEKDWLSGINTVKEVNAKIVLIVGNNEERVIAEFFNNDFEKFKQYCIDLGFKDVLKELHIIIDERQIYLNHYPKNHKDEHVNLFGHTHRQTGIWKPYGLNVGTDLNHFRLYSQEDILALLEQKEQWWDLDINNNCM